MFFHSKLFKFLLPLFAYLLFAFQWVYNYMAVWYTNVPEETQYFKKPNMGNYTMYGYLLIISFVLFLVFGIIYLIKNPVPKFVTYILMADLFFSSYYVWHYSTAFKGLQSARVIIFCNLVLFGLSIFKLGSSK
jgi:hypothetical protein